MAWNRGVNFGLMAGGESTRWLLVALALGISVWVAVWLTGPGPGAGRRSRAGCSIGGALGNTVDRVLYGAVADFLNMSCCGIENPYAFNVADIAIFLGAVGLAVLGSGAGAAGASKPHGRRCARTPPPPLSPQRPVTPPPQPAKGKADGQGTPMRRATILAAVLALGACTQRRARPHQLPLGQRVARTSSACVPTQPLDARGAARRASPRCRRRPRAGAT